MTDSTSPADIDPSASGGSVEVAVHVPSPSYRGEGCLLSPSMEMMSKRHFMSNRTINWTTMKTPATLVGDALADEVTQLQHIKSGVKATKVTTRGHFRGRVLTISQDKFALFCTHAPIKRKEGIISGLAFKLPVPLITRKGIRGVSTNATRENYVRYIDVADLDDVQVGVVGTHRLESSRKLNRLKGKDSEIDKRREEIVTILHHGNESLDVLIPDAKQRDELVNCLRQMRKVYLETSLSVTHEALLLRYIWYDVDTNRDGKISQEEFKKILSRINFRVKNAAKKYQEYVKRVPGKDKSLKFSQVMEFLQKLKNEETQRHKSMANQLWDNLFGGPDVHTVDATEFLTKFVHQIQGQRNVTEDEVSDLFVQLNAMELSFPDANGENEGVRLVNRQIGRARFAAFLYHEMNAAFDPWALGRHADMPLDRPMSHYWVNSSHNTYLSGDQLKSSSSVQMYLRALRRGCKCLELDCWDGETVNNKGGDDAQHIPVVFHGHTLTSKIIFADIIRGIKSFLAQYPETYPIILSLEIHCSHPFQKAMAQILTDILGSSLYVPTKRDMEGELPSPASLQGKVVIKGKRPPALDDLDAGDALNVEEDPYDAANTVDTSASPVGGSMGSVKSSKRSKSSKKSNEPDPLASGALLPEDGKPIKPAKPPKIVKELARLTLFHGTKFHQFEKSIANNPSHMHSIGETKIGKILNVSSDAKDQWREYNVRHLTRTYPAGARVDSSNYNPVLAWAVGCQLVALNFQTSDTPLLLNDGLFRQNAGCGYLLKPNMVMGEAFNRSREQAKKQGEQQQQHGRDKANGASLAAVKKNSSSDEEKPLDVDSSRQQPTKTKESESMIKRMMDSCERDSQGRVVVPLRLQIRVLSGSCLPKPRGAKTGETIDPYVVVTVHDVKRNEEGKVAHVSSSHTTSTVYDNGFCPVWDEKTFKDFIVYTPDVAMVHFSLGEADVGLDDKVGDTCIPVICLRTGLRSVQLFDENGSRTGPYGFASLLVEIRSAQIR